MKILAASVLMGGAVASAQSTIDPASAYAYSANVGWIHFRPSLADGVSVHAYHLAGKAYGANTGWMDFGNGSPVSGYAYSNTSASDCGVNHDGAGNLSGYAYAANLGWINFGWATANDSNRPRFDPFTGRFQGYAWSANCGWILLGPGLLGTSSITRVDSDNDGIADEWEFAYFGNLTVAGATSDGDGDGVSDKQEFLADTNPLDPLSSPSLRIVSSIIVGGSHLSTLEWRSRPSRIHTLETSTTLLPGSWVPLRERNGTGLPVTFDHSSNDPRRFYRIISRLPLP